MSSPGERSSDCEAISVRTLKYLIAYRVDEYCTVDVHLTLGLDVLKATYNITITATAVAQLRAVKDVRVRGIIADKIDDLAHEPSGTGYPLSDELADHRSVRTVGQRYRIIYRVEASERRVHIVVIGIRRAGSREDVYAVAARLSRRGLI